jgi:hypothetical protein
MESPRSEFTDNVSNGDELVLAVDSIMDQVRSDDGERRIKAAKEIRRLAKTCSKNRRLFSNAIEPLVDMLRSGRDECSEAAILALLNLGVKDERYDLSCLLLLLVFGIIVW